MAKRRRPVFPAWFDMASCLPCSTTRSSYYYRCICINQNPDRFALAHGQQGLTYASIIYSFQFIATLETNIHSDQWGGFADRWAHRARSICATVVARRQHPPSRRSWGCWERFIQSTEYLVLNVDPPEAEGPPRLRNNQFSCCPFFGGGGLRINLTGKSHQRSLSW